MISSSSPVQSRRSLGSSDIATGATCLARKFGQAAVSDQGRICFRTIRQIQTALRSIASDESNIHRQSRRLLSLCSKFGEDAYQQYHAIPYTVGLSWKLPSNPPLSAAGNPALIPRG